MGDDRAIGKFEELCIRVLQPPTQRQSNSANLMRVKANMRLWPKDRKKPTVEGEKRLNMHYCNHWRPNANTDFQAIWPDFQQYVEWYKREHGLTKEDIVARLYTYAHMFGLLLFLAEPNTRMVRYCMQRHQPSKKLTGSSGIMFMNCS